MLITVTSRLHAIMLQSQLCYRDGKCLVSMIIVLPETWPKAMSCDQQNDLIRIRLKARNYRVRDRCLLLCAVHLRLNPRNIWWECKCSHERTQKYSVGVAKWRVEIKQLSQFHQTLEKCIYCILIDIVICESVWWCMLNVSLALEESSKIFFG